MDIHQQAWLSSSHHFLQSLLRHPGIYIVVGRYYGMTAHFRRTIYHPITCFLFLETAFVTDPVLHFTPLVFARRNAKHLISTVPQRNLARTFGAIAVRIH